MCVGQSLALTLSLLSSSLSEHAPAMSAFHHIPVRKMEGAEGTERGRKVEKGGGNGGEGDWEEGEEDGVEGQ